MPNLVEIGPVILEKKMKMWYGYDDDDDKDNDDVQILIRKLTWAFGSGKLKNTTSYSGIEWMVKWIIVHIICTNKNAMLAIDWNL